VVQLVIGDLGEPRAVQTDPAHRAPVRILFDQPGGGEVHHPLGPVDAQDLPHRPLPGGDLPEQRAGAQVIPVQVAPAIPLRVPQHLVGQHPHDRRLGHPLVGLHTGAPGLAEHGGYLAGGRFQPVQGECVQVTGLAEVVHRRAVLRPPRPFDHDRRELRHEQRLGLRADHRARLHVQDDQLGVGHLLVPGVGVPLGVQEGRAAVGGPGLHEVGLPDAALIGPMRQHLR